MENELIAGAQPLVTEGGGGIGGKDNEALDSIELGKAAMSKLPDGGALSNAGMGAAVTCGGGAPRECGEVLASDDDHPPTFRDDVGRAGGGGRSLMVQCWNGFPSVFHFGLI